MSYRNLHNIMKMFVNIITVLHNCYGKLDLVVFTYFLCRIAKKLSNNNYALQKNKTYYINLMQNCHTLFKSPQIFAKLCNFTYTCNIPTKILNIKYQNVKIHTYNKLITTF